MIDKEMIDKAMEKDEAQFHKLFSPMRAVTPSIGALHAVLARLPGGGSVTPRSPKRSSYVGTGIYGYGYSVVVLFATLVIFFSPLLHPLDVTSEVYAMEIDNEEIAETLASDELTVETGYIDSSIDLVGEETYYQYYE